MIALLQRVAEARVDVGDELVGRIGAGLLVLLAVEPADDVPTAERMIERLLRYRVFDDAAGRMNLSVLDRRGGRRLVPQFTLSADSRKGLYPTCTSAEVPA